MRRTIVIVRFLPSWLPGAQFKRLAKGFRKQLSQIDMAPHTWAKEQIVSTSSSRFLSGVHISNCDQASGKYTESFTSQYMNPEDGHAVQGDEEDIVKWCAAALYVGGADTVRPTAATASPMSHNSIVLLIRPFLR